MLTKDVKQHMSNFHRRNVVSDFGTALTIEFETGGAPASVHHFDSHLLDL